VPIADAFYPRRDDSAIAKSRALGGTTAENTHATSGFEPQRV